MKIRFLSGPNAGKIDHAPISQETDLLIKAGLVEVVHEEPAPPAPPSFGVLYGYRNAGASLQATCPNCHRLDYFVGEPKREIIAERFIKFLCVHFRGAEVPEQVLVQYADAWRYQTFAAPGTRGAVSKNTPDGAPHYHVVDGAIAPCPPPKGWLKIER